MPSSEFERAAMELRVAGAQIPVTQDVEANIAAIERGIEFASEERADILLTPEGSLSGYTHKFDVSAVRKGLDIVTSKASKSGVGLALGTCYVEEADDKCFDQLRFYLPNGKYLGFHSKTLRCGSLADPLEGEINHYALSEIRTFEFKGVTIAGLICNDMWAYPLCTPEPDPHLSQRLAGMGAKVIFHAVNGERNGGEWSRKVAWPYMESNLRVRARAAGIWIVTVDSSYPLNIPCAAPSGVIDTEGIWRCHTTPQGEQSFVYTISLPENS